MKNLETMGIVTGEATVYQIERAVERLRDEHRDKWLDCDDSYWFYRLSEEVGELGASLARDHDDTPEWKMAQVASICLNWLAKRYGAT